MWRTVSSILGEDPPDRKAALSVTQCGFRLTFFLMGLVGGAKGLELDDAGFVADPPGDDLFGVLTVVCFDDRPPAVGAVVVAHPATEVITAPTSPGKKSIRWCRSNPISVAAARPLYPERIRGRFVIKSSRFPPWLRW